MFAGRGGNLKIFDAKDSTAFCTRVMSCLLGSRWSSSSWNQDSIGSSSIFVKHYARLLRSLFSTAPDITPNLHLIYEAMPPSRTRVQGRSFRVTKSRTQPKKSQTKPLNLNQWSTRLRQRPESPAAQSPGVHLEKEPNSLRPSNPNEAVGPKTAGQNNRPLKRRRVEDDSEAAQPEASKPQSPRKRNRLGEQDTEPTTLGFAGVQAIKPLTRKNLDILQETMPDPDQTSAARSRVCSFVLWQILAI